MNADSNPHMKNHEYEIMRWCCEGCGRDYKRKDHFDKHVEKCCKNIASVSFCKEENMIDNPETVSKSNIVNEIEHEILCAA